MSAQDEQPVGNALLRNCKHVQKYSGTFLLQTPLGPNYLSWSMRCLYFRETNICILHEVGTLSSVLISQGVLV